MRCRRRLGAFPCQPLPRIPGRRRSSGAPLAWMRAREAQPVPCSPCMFAFAGIARVRQPVQWSLGMNVPAGHSSVRAAAAPPASRASASASTCTPREMSAGEANSSGRWLQPLRHGMKTMPVGAICKGGGQRRVGDRRPAFRRYSRGVCPPSCRAGRPGQVLGATGESATATRQSGTCLGHEQRIMVSAADHALAAEPPLPTAPGRKSGAIASKHATCELERQAHAGYSGRAKGDSGRLTGSVQPRRHARC